MTTEPTPPSPAPANAPDPSRRLHRPRLWAHHAFRFYKNVDKVDDWAGGGLGFSTLVKIAGWVGLLAVIAALVIKVREVEKQLDPIEHGVDTLDREVAHAQAELQKDVVRSRGELDGLANETRSLEKVLKEAAALEAKTQGELALSEAATRDLKSQLDGVVATTQAMSAAQHKAQDDLAGVSDAAEALRGSLKTQGDQTSAGLKALADGARASQGKLADLDKNAATVSAALGQSTTRLDKNAQAISEVVTKLNASSAALEGVVQRRLQAKASAPAKASASASASAPAQAPAPVPDQAPAAAP